MKSVRSLQRKMMRVAMATTLAALLLSAALLLAHDVRTHRQTWVADLTTQADLVARSSAPALAFDDAREAQENLGLLRLRPQIEAAAIYRADGALFASFVAAGSVAPPPRLEATEGHRFDLDTLALAQRIEQNGELLGTMYLRAHYELSDRLGGYLLILGIVTAASLVLAAALFSRLQRRIMAPFIDVARVARAVVKRRDYTLRARRSETDDEAALLVDAFNDMLQEIGRRADALRDADRRKDEFLATLAHELRNPLAPLANALEIQKRAGDDPALRQRLQLMMERQLRQLVRLIDDLLDVSRITKGKLELKRETVDLQQIIEAALDTTRGVIAENGHELMVRAPDGPLWLDADATRLAQVFANLLNNAAKYTSQGGRIELEVQPRDDAVLVHVRDNGIGIAREQQQQVFDMFVQVDRSLERGARAGLGVGLSLARQLVELHGGTLTLASEGLGRGSVFTVNLPRGAAAAPAPRPEAAGMHAAGAPRDILIADDNTDFADSIGDLLRALGHRVRVVYDGQAGLEAALARPPDVALFDIGMPGLNGYELARRLRERPATSHIRMVAVTGWGQEGDRERAREAGFDGHLVKPVAIDRVLEALD